MTTQTIGLDEILVTLREAEKHHRYNKMDFFVPYTKQKEFFDNGAEVTERALMAGNRQGKTEAGAYEAACHATGIYPPWWKGRRWDRPTVGWVIGESSLVTRDVQQEKLCGEPGVSEAFGTGMIPKHLFVDNPSLSRGVTDAYDTVQVRHVSGGVSVIRFKSFEQGRAKFQGTGIDWAWPDEECPLDVYSEIRTRTIDKGGMTYTTFTPLKGKTDLVLRFTDQVNPDRRMVVMTMDDALHIPKEEQDRILSQWPVHERQARRNGVPMMGEGRIFPYDEALISEPSMLPDNIPMHWRKLWSIDFGIGHPFAAVLNLVDLDNDVIHVHHAIRMPDALPMMHAAAMKPIGIQVPVAWPQDGTAREKSGETVHMLYRKEGLRMLPGHATWADGGISTEAGIIEMQQRMQMGRYKVAAHLGDWWDEYRNYHRKDGKIVKVRDDLMSASRIGVMARRYAAIAPLGGKPIDKSRRSPLAIGTDFDVFY